MWQRGQRQLGPGRVVAHRAGAAFAGPDPLASARKIIELGFEMVEFDVRETSDGILVVHHDEDVGGRKLSEHRYADLVETTASLPLLSDFLRVVAGKLALDIELKEPGYEQRVVSSVLGAVPPDQVVFTSFEDAAVKAISDLDAGVGVGLLVGRRRGLATPLVVARDAFPFARMEKVQADFLAPSRALLVATGLQRRAARRGIGLLIWGVNDPRVVRQLAATPGVLGVITDNRDAHRPDPHYPPDVLGKRRLPK